MVEFVSYDGKYPNLCSGILVLRIDGVEVAFPRYCMESGGSTDWHNDEIYYGPWSLWNDYIPVEYRHLKDEILRVVNENVPWGCCGGCI